MLHKQTGSELQMQMTAKQIARLGEALNNTSKTQFAQPQQSEYIKLAAKEHGMPEKNIPEFLIDIAPVLNASAMLQALKKMGVIPAEMTAKQKAEAAQLLTALKS